MVGYRRRNFERGVAVDMKEFQRSVLPYGGLAVWWAIGEEALRAAMLWRNVYFFLIKNIIIGF